MGRDKGTAKDRDKLPPLNALRNFEAVARHGSFAGAATDGEAGPDPSSSAGADRDRAAGCCYARPGAGDGFAASRQRRAVRLIANNARAAIDPTSRFSLAPEC